MVDWPEPQAREDVLLVRSRGIGIRGTDVEIIAGEYGEAPPAEEQLILGHESLGEVLQAPPGSGFEPGQLLAALATTQYGLDTYAVDIIESGRKPDLVRDVSCRSDPRVDHRG